MLKLSASLETHHHRTAKSHTLPIGGIYRVIADPTTVVILFRGTTNLDDWMVNMAIAQAPSRLNQTLKHVAKDTFALVEPQRLLAVSSRLTSSRRSVVGMSQTSLSDGCEIHQGFLDRYLHFRDVLWSVLDDPQYPTQRVWIGGHSLGGAMANIAALDIAMNATEGLTDIRVYTTATPRVGNPVFAREFHKYAHISQFFQFQNSADVVPTLPLAVIPNFQQPMKPYVYEHAGTILSYSANWQSLQLNHYISNYIAALTGYVSRK
jgi:predicted lipase